MAVLSSSASLVEQIQSYRSFSAGWTSRVLQGAVSWLLQDAGTHATVGKARAAYRERRHALAAALGKHGIEFEAGDGLSVLVPVISESYALVTLAAHGIAVHPGSKFSLKPANTIRVATSVMPLRETERVARAIQAACAVPR